MLLYACISAHGFRTCAIVGRLARDHPQVRLVLSSALLPWFLESHLQGIPHHRHWMHRDVGAIRRDALTIDWQARRHAPSGWGAILAGIISTAPGAAGLQSGQRCMGPSTAVPRAYCACPWGWCCLQRRPLPC
ncbi:MAG: hypothetical protein OXG70_01985 [Cyanobacteria bacterium MAG IRC1_bin_28]|nr:hypothetical protein [Cyanobacteria bacterium MAG IRC1_bin_28]